MSTVGESTEVRFVRNYGEYLETLEDTEKISIVLPPEITQEVLYPIIKVFGVNKTRIVMLEREIYGECQLGQLSLLSTQIRCYKGCGVEPISKFLLTDLLSWYDDGVSVRITSKGKLVTSQASAIKGGERVS